MTKVDFKVDMYKGRNGEYVDKLTVLIDGEEANSFRKSDLVILMSKDDANLKADLKRYLMSKTRGKKDEAEIIDKVIAKIQSLTLG